MHYLSFLAFPSLPSGSVCRGVGCAEQLFIALCREDAAGVGCSS